MANAPETVTVKVVSAWDNGTWYADKIGETFEAAEDLIGYSYYVYKDKFDSVRAFHPDDIEVIDA